MRLWQAYIQGKIGLKEALKSHVVRRVISACLINQRMRKDGRWPLRVVLRGKEKDIAETLVKNGYAGREKVLVGLQEEIAYYATPKLRDELGGRIRVLQGAYSQMLLERVRVEEVKHEVG